MDDTFQQKLLVFPYLHQHPELLCRFFGLHWITIPNEVSICSRYYQQEEIWEALLHYFINRENQENKQKLHSTCHRKGKIKTRIEEPEKTKKETKP